MIVIATHNGKEFLPGILQGLTEFGTNGRAVVLVDTGSSCKESLALLERVQGEKWPFPLEVSRTPYRGFDSGAYIFAFRNYQADSYLFLQDSVCPKSPGWATAFEERLTYGVGCVPWLAFPMQWNCQEQIDWVEDKFATLDWPPMGVFGPIFMASRTALSDLDSKGYLDAIPTCKLEQMAMERGWATAFALSGWGIRPIESFFEETLLRSDAYPCLTKRFAWRT